MPGNENSFNLMPLNSIDPKKNIFWSILKHSHITKKYRPKSSNQNIVCLFQVDNCFIFSDDNRIIVDS